MDSPPKIFEYLEVVAYLQDYYRFRKSRDRQFSYETWSQELDFNSRSFLRMLITGKKKITPKFIEAFGRLNFATKAEEEYFASLVKYSQAGNPKERHKQGAKMMHLLRHQQGAERIEDHKDFLSNPLLPRILALLSFEDLHTDIDSLVKILGRTLPDVQQALKKLAEMGLAEVSDKRWRAKSDVFQVPDHYGSFDLMKFHEISLHEAIAAFTRPKELRRYKSLLLPMSPEGLQDFNRLLDDFANEQMLRFNSKTYSGKRMFQVNFNLHPVAEMEG